MVAERRAAAETLARSEQSNRELTRRQALLNAVVATSSDLLATSTLAETGTRVVQALLPALAVDRCCIAVMEPPDTHSRRGYFVLAYEATAPGIARQSDMPGLARLNMDHYADYLDALAKGEPLQIDTDEFCSEAARAEQEASGAVSQFQYPVLVDGEFVAVVGADDCRVRRRWDDAEVATLRLVASSIGSVIKRERLVRARIDAERERADTAERAALELSRRRELLDAVVSISNDLLASEALAPGAQSLVEGLRTALRADRCALGFFEPPDAASQHGYVRFDYEAVAPGTARQTDNPALVRFNLDDYVEFFVPLQRGEAMQMLTDEIVSEAGRAEQQATGAVSQFVYPIMLDGQLSGLLNADDCRAARRWDEAEIATLHLVASAVASVIQRERLTQARIDAERERAQQLERANQVLASNMQALALDATPATIMQRIAQQMAALFGAHIAAVFQLSPDGSQTIGGVIFDHGVFVEPPIQAAIFSARMSEIPGWQRILASAEPTLMRLPADAAMIHPDTMSFMAERGLHCLINLPLRVNGRPRWVLAITSRDDERATAQNLSLLQTLSHQLMMALELKRLAEETEAAGLRRAQAEAERERERALRDERDRIAHDIHDTLAQGFTGVTMQLQAARNALARRKLSQAEQHIASANELARTSLVEARESVYAIRAQTLAESGLAEALRALVLRFNTPDVLQVSFELRGQAISLPPPAEQALLRVAQESLANVAKHARASRCTLRLVYAADAVSLSVRDDGVGFDVGAGTSGLGIAGMRSRAGQVGAQLLLASLPGAGTEVVFTVGM